MTAPAGRRLTQLAELPVSVLRGVGERTTDQLAALGIASVLDLLLHYPRRFVDATRVAPLADAAPGETVTALASVTSVRTQRSAPRGRRSMVRVEVGLADGSGAASAVFFNQGWRARQLAEGMDVLVHGKLGEYRGRVQFANPTVEVVRTGGDERASGGRIYPVYPLSERAELTSAQLSRLVGEALDRAGEFADPVGEVLEGTGLVDRTAGFNGYHRPSDPAEIGPARDRLAFDEFFRLQLALQLRQARLAADARAIRHDIDPRGRPFGLVSAFLAGLPFEPTGAQRRAVAAILDDLAGETPMHRLLQGDVGSGKTVVALAALLVAVGGGHQGAFMAPTEVLAEQHAAAVTRLLGTLTVPDPGRLGGERPLEVALLTSRTPAGERTRVVAGLAEGAVDIVIGTHALLTDDVRFASLGVVVIDEQHRFGVEQRAQLRDKGRGPEGAGRDPDVLVMTATPIPRTAAMVVFGDLDMTVIEELPAGRAPITTTWARETDEVAAAWARVRDEVGSGHRAYVVCALVEGSERVEASAVTDEIGRLGAGELAGLRLGLLHGQMRPVEKDEVMSAFRRGELDVLVATTVVEVGVDVPEATVMVVENAERFGIAQLHQLRGRVGRSDLPSWCYLLSDTDQEDAGRRLEALVATTDGFELARVDLELRGTGTILGERQQGRSDLRLGRVLEDGDLIELARERSARIVAADPELAAHPMLAEELRCFVDEAEAAFLFKS